MRRNHVDGSAATDAAAAQSAGYRRAVNRMRQDNKTPHWPGAVLCGRTLKTVQRRRVVQAELEHGTVLKQAACALRAVDGAAYSKHRFGDKADRASDVACLQDALERNASSNLPGGKIDSEHSAATRDTGVFALLGAALKNAPMQRHATAWKDNVYFGEAVDNSFRPGCRDHAEHGAEM